MRDRAEKVGIARSVTRDIDVRVAEFAVKFRDARRAVATRRERADPHYLRSVIHPVSALWRNRRTDSRPLISRERKKKNRRRMVNSELDESARYEVSD